MNGFVRSLFIFAGAALTAGTAIGLPLLLLSSSSSAVSAAATADGDGVLRVDGGSEFGWDQDSWYVQVDGVMGGKSSGDLEFLALSDEASASDSSNNDSNKNENDSNKNENENDLVLKFTGDISLDGGGFSSVRRRIDLDLSDYAGVVVTLRAENVASSASATGIAPPTGLHLQMGDATSYYDFSSALAVPLSNGSGDHNDDNTEVWTSVYLPMESFDRGTRFGFVCSNCRFDPSTINNLSVYVLFQEGGFDVRIRSIAAVREPVAFRSPRAEFASATEIANLLRATVASGGGLYDKTYTELCVAMYWSVLNSLLTVGSPGDTSSNNNDAFVVPDPVKAVICAGLQQTESTLFSSEETSTSNKIDHSAAAWALRYTIDAVVADLMGYDRPDTGGNGNWLPSPDAAESMDATCVGRTSPAPGTLYDPVVGTDGDENANTNDDASIPVSYDDDDDVIVVEGTNATTAATTAMNDPPSSVEASAIRKSATAIPNANANSSNNGNGDTVVAVAAASTGTSGASMSSHQHRTRFGLVSWALWTLLLVALVA